MDGKKIPNQQSAEKNMWSRLGVSARMAARLSATPTRGKKHYLSSCCNVYGFEHSSDDLKF